MGMFGLYNYDKEGPGISKNAPKKRTVIVFFETFFRNFWKFAPISAVYSLISLPLVTSGLGACGMTNVARNTARDKHSFGLSDFFDTIKKNWKQALPVGIINIIVYAILFFDAVYFFGAEGTVATVCMGLTLALIFVFTVMNYYIWTLMITFKFTVKQIYKNSFKFVFINIKNNIICFVAQLLCLLLYVLILWALQNWFLLVMTVEMLIFMFTFPSFQYLLVQYCVFPSIRKYIIDPYYEQHPDEDLDKRRDLGIYEEEPEDEESEGEETEDTQEES